MVEQAIEVEFKFEVTHPEKIGFLSELERVDEKHVNDVYLDTSDGSLFLRAIYIRIRNNKTLDFKFDPEQFNAKTGEGVHEQCLEYNFKLPLHETDLEPLNKLLLELELKPVQKADLSELKRNNNLVDAQVFNKIRTKYRKAPFEYCLDRIENFGTFLEIDTTTNDPAEAEKRKEQIREMSRSLGLRLITTGYCELWWRKFDFDLYLGGKFLLEEDRLYYGHNGLVSKTVRMLEKEFATENTGHDWEHFRRVWKTARKIAVEENANVPVVELAALLHDIADWKMYGGNRKKSEEAARQWLEQNKADPQTVETVCQAIRDVSFKVNANENIPSTLEGKIVQDADRLDGLGAIGVIRAVSYGAALNRKLYDPTILPKNNLTQEEFSQRSIAPKDDTTINHFYEKLLLLKDRMHTQTAKQIAEHRHRFMEQFLDEFLAEWDAKK